MTTFEIILAIVFIVLLLLIIRVFRGRRKFETKPKTTLYTQALNHILQGEYSIAIKKLKSIIERDTSHIDAYIKLGDTLRKAGKLKQAVKIHQTLLYRQDIDRMQKLEVMRNLVYDYEDLNEKGIALSVALNILDLDKKNKWALERIWHLYRDLKKWNKASEYMEKVFQQRKEHNKRALALYKVQEGLEKYDRGAYHDARVIFRKAARIDPQCEAIYYYMAESYLKEKRDAEAVEWWEKFAETAPGKAWLIFPKLQKVLFNYGNFGRIEEFYQKILKAEPNNIRTITALASFYERKGDLTRAKDIVSDLIETNPDSIIAKVAYSKLLIALRRDREASDVLTEVLNQFNSIKDIRCSNCGHLADKALWICPVCGQEDSFLD